MAGSHCVAYAQHMGKTLLLLVVCLSASCGQGASAESSARSSTAQQSPPPARVTVLRPDQTFVLRFRAPYLTDNDLDAYRATVRGPGGTDCSARATYGGGMHWNPRYNSWHRRHVTRFTMPPDRGLPRTGVADPTGPWCVGDYSGQLVFIDYPAGERHGTHGSRFCSRAQVRAGKCVGRKRLIKRFTFAVR